MDLLAVLRMMGSLALVLGLLFAALWAVRRFNVRLPGAASAGARRLELVERTAIDPKRSVVLLRRDGREHLLLIAPDGHLVIESGIRLDTADRKAQAEREAELERQRADQEAAMANAREQFVRRTSALAGRAKSLGQRSVTAASRAFRRRSDFARLVDLELPSTGAKR